MQARADLILVVVASIGPAAGTNSKEPQQSPNVVVLADLEML